MPLGAKWDYFYWHNLKFSRLFNLAKNLLTKKEGYLNYFPRRYMIEPTTVCTLKCKHCFHYRYDKKIHFTYEHLFLENFLIILKKIKKYALLIELYNYGEPFLNKQTPFMIAASTRAGIRTRISSNMNVPMDDDYARSIVEAGLYRLTCSIDGHTQKIYEKYRENGNLALALENSQKIISWKQKLKARYPRMVFRMLVFEWNYKYIKEAKALATQYGFDEFCADPGAYTVNGQKVMWNIEKQCWQPGSSRFVNQNQTIQKNTKQPCEWLFNALVINSNGNVLPCCFPYERKAEHLSLISNSLQEVWNSPEYQATRLYARGLQNDREHVLTACKYCTRL